MSSCFHVFLLKMDDFNMAGMSSRIPRREEFAVWP
jgi:hypothetical protein